VTATGWIAQLHFYTEGIYPASVQLRRKKNHAGQEGKQEDEVSQPWEQKENYQETIIRTIYES